MKKKKNCWDIMACERQPGGAKVEELGVCASAVPCDYEGVNGGIHGGRFCWRITGTFCGGRPQGTAAQKTLNCLSCPFFKQVVKEEGANFKLSPADFLDKTG